MPQTPAPTRANVRQSATWRISDTNLSPPCQLTTHAADSMLFLSKSRLFGFLPTKFPEYPNSQTGRGPPLQRTALAGLVLEGGTARTLEPDLPQTDGSLPQ